MTPCGGHTGTSLPYMNTLSEGNYGKGMGGLSAPTHHKHTRIQAYTQKTQRQPMRKWRIEDSEELYNIKGWGVNYFGINDKGHAFVRPKKDDVQIDLADVMEDLSNADITAPVLLRFPDILNNRIEKTAGCFAKAEKEYDYKGEHFIVYPIKVNQMRPVVEEIISHGKKYNLGLECGSKPELHAVLATNMDSDSIIV